MLIVGNYSFRVYSGPVACGPILRVLDLGGPGSSLSRFPISVKNESLAVGEFGENKATSFCPLWKSLSKSTVLQPELITYSLMGYGQ